MVNNSVVLGMWDGRVGRMQYIFNYLFLIVISTVGLSIAGVFNRCRGERGVDYRQYPGRHIRSVILPVCGLAHSEAIARLRSVRSLASALPASIPGLFDVDHTARGCWRSRSQQVRRGQRQRYRRLFSVRQITATRARI